MLDVKTTKNVIRQGMTDCPRSPSNSRKWFYHCPTGCNVAPFKHLISKSFNKN